MSDGDGIGERALEVARRVAARLAGDGAAAVVLTGSFARGAGRAESDIDLAAIGEGSAYRLEREEPFLVSVSWRTEEDVRREFANPELVGMMVPGWREAVLLHDPEGVAARLKAAAEAWSWDAVAEAGERWVAQQVTGHAEEVHKVAAALDAPTVEAAALAPLLAFRMAKVVAARRRLLYRSERELARAVADEMAGEWRVAFDAAMGMGDEPLRDRMRASLAVYRIAAAEVGELLDDRERAVVEHAVRLSESGATP